MKAVLNIILAALTLSSIFAHAESVARFSNHDRITGSMQSLSSEFLVWKSSALEKPIPFFLKNVVDISLPGDIPKVTADHETTLTLTNGDTVHGQLAAVTDEMVSLDTWYAGRMNFNHTMIASVKIKDMSPMLYRGPFGLDGWTQSNDHPAWTYENSAFRSNRSGSIAKNNILPDECTITFDVAWKSDSIALKVILFSSDPTSENPESGYDLSFQHGSIYLRNGKTRSFLGSTQSQTLIEQDKVKIEIRASRTSGKVCLFINEHCLDVWTDPNFANNKFGSCLHFVALNTLPMKISSIGVAPWNGTIEQLPGPRAGLFRGNGFRNQTEDPETAPPEPDNNNRMKLANGDSLEGEVTSIQKGIIAVKTPLGDVKIPLSKLRTVTLKKVGLETPIKRNGDIRAWLPDNTTLVFRLIAVNDDTITGDSQNFGTATFKLSAFSRIEFNIYDNDHQDKPVDDEW